MEEMIDAANVLSSVGEVWRLPVLPPRPVSPFPSDVSSSPPPEEQSAELTLLRLENTKLRSEVSILRSTATQLSVDFEEAQLRLREASEEAEGWKKRYLAARGYGHVYGAGYGPANVVERSETMVERVR